MTRANIYGNGWKWRKLDNNGQNGCKLMEMDENGWKWMKRGIYWGGVE